MWLNIEAMIDVMTEKTIESASELTAENKSPAPARYHPHLRPPTPEDRAKASAMAKQKAALRKDAALAMEILNFEPLKELIDMFNDPETGQRVKSQIGLELLSYKYTKPKDKMQADATTNLIQDLAQLIGGSGRPLPPTALDTIDAESVTITPKPGDPI